MNLLWFNNEDMFLINFELIWMSYEVLNFIYYYFSFGDCYNFGIIEFMILNNIFDYS